MSRVAPPKEDEKIKTISQEQGVEEEKEEEPSILLGRSVNYPETENSEHGETTEVPHALGAHASTGGTIFAPQTVVSASQNNEEVAAIGCPCVLL